MRTLRRRAAGYFGVGIAALAVVTMGGTSTADALLASGVFEDVSCTTSPNVGNQLQDIPYGVEAPTEVTAGEHFQVSFPGGSAELPAVVLGFVPVSYYKNLATSYQVQGGTFDQASFQPGGDTTINGTPTAATVTYPAADSIKFSVTGPVVPGTLATPTRTIDVIAGAAGSTINIFELQLTTTVGLGNPPTEVTATCNVPQTVLIAINVVEGGTTTSTEAPTTTSTTTTTLPPTTTSTTTTTLPPTTTSTTTTTLPPTTTSTTTTTVAPTTTSTTTTSTTTTTLPPTTTSTTTTTVAPTTTSTSTTTLAPTTTSTTTLAPTSTSTTSVASTTTTTIGGTTTTGPVGTECKPGWGKGDKNHCHSGPPGQTGISPKPISSTRPVDDARKTLLLGALLLIPLVDIGFTFRRRLRRV